MIDRVIRVLLGLAFAFLAAGITLVLFVYSPLELLEGSSKAAEAGLLALAAATHGALFAAPFALSVAAIGEWRRFGSWLYYALSGTTIAGIGFLAQYATEAVGEASIANAYALGAFLAAGLAGGLVYRLVAGRRAAAPVADRDRSGIPPARPAEGASKGAV
jgi:hypothetical protein